MRVSILGPIEIVGPHGPRAVPGLRRRAVLVALALEPGHVVSTERLVDLVWGEAAPNTVRNTLQAHVSFLRRAFGDRTAVRAVPPGYVLRFDSPAGDDESSDATDAQAAERLVLEASREADPARCADRAQAAVALWRGPALADVAELAAFHGSALWLEDVRVRALCLLVHSRLALGLVEPAVEAARMLWRDHPLDERSGGLLMLALYRAGRQADALAVCRAIRRGLRDELGVEPGRALHELEAAILRQDPDVLRGTLLGADGLGRAGPATLLLPADQVDHIDQVKQVKQVGPSSASPPVPAQLPGSVDLVGREAELCALDAQAGRVTDPDRPGPAVIAAITGTAGVGKTALAVRSARRVARRFPDGQLYANLHGYGPGETVVDTGEVLRSFLTALGVPAEHVPADHAGRAALFRGVLARKRVLILLDNARDAEQIRPLLPGASGCLVIATSRDRLVPLVAQEGAAPIPLDPLPPDAAHELLVRRLGEDRIGAEPAAVRSVIENCEGLPLALGLAAAWAATHPRLPISAFAVKISALATTFSALDGGDCRTDLRAVFSWSYRTLSEEAARLYRFQSCRPGPGFTVPVAASLTAVPPHRAAELVAELARASLLTEYAPGRFGAHDLLCRFAYQESIAHDAAEVRQAAVHRLLDHYVHTADAAARLVDPGHRQVSLPEPPRGVVPERFTSRDAALAWLRAEDAELLAAVEKSALDDLDTRTWRLAVSATPRLVADQRWAELAAVCGMGLPAARRCSDPVGIALLTAALARQGPTAGPPPALSAPFQYRISGSDDGGATPRKHLRGATRMGE